MTKVPPINLYNVDYFLAYVLAEFVNNRNIKEKR